MAAAVNAVALHSTLPWQCLRSALMFFAAWILNVLVLRSATDGETEMVGQHSGLVDLCEW